MSHAHQTNQRSKLHLLGLLALGLVGCSGCVSGQLAASTNVRLSGVLTQRGGQTESWFGVRTTDGQLWRLEPANTQIADQLQQLLQQNVQITGEVISSPMPPPIFRVHEVILAK